jgi:hypothetical protein
MLLIYLFNFLAFKRHGPKVGLAVLLVGTHLDRRLHGDSSGTDTEFRFDKTGIRCLFAVFTGQNSVSVPELRSGVDALVVQTFDC